MAVYHDPTNPDAAILALLQAGDTADLATGGVFPIQAHDGADAPHVVVSAVSDMPMHALGGGSRVQTINYLVRCVGLDETEANGLAAAVDSDLHGATPAITGYTALCLIAAGAGQRYADGDGFYTATAYYSLRLYKNS